MTHHTEAERPWWRDRADEIEQQVGMGKMDAMACYTQMVQLLDAERRAPAAPVPQGWTDDQMISFAWMILLNGGSHVDSIEQRLEKFRGFEVLRGNLTPTSAPQPLEETK